MMGAAPAPENAVLEAALAYARRGWPVLPLQWITPEGCSCGNAKCPTPGKHPRSGKGEHDASTDSGQIRRWWKVWPLANVGIRTGPRSGLVVLDIDPRHGGDETLLALEKTNGPLPASIEAISGSSGRHIFFQHPGRPVKSQNGIWPGIDIKGDTGYVVAAPSLHANGSRYAWDVSLHPDDTALAEMPVWLRWKVRTTLEVAPESAEELGETIADGKRNNVLTSLAGSMRRRGMVAEEIEVVLLTVNARRCAPPLDEEEVRKVAKSVMRYAPQDVPLGDLPDDPLPDSVPDGVVFADEVVTGAELVARYAGDPEPLWLVDQLIPAIGMTLLTGRPKRGKTLLAEHLAVEAARGGVWLGKQVKQGPAVIVQADQGWRTTARRLQHWGVEDLPLYVLAHRGIALHHIAKFEEGLAALKPRVVILDAAAVLLAVKSEYDNQEVATATARITALGERLNCAFLLVHHNRKAETADDALVSVRGGTAWSGAADSILELHGGENGSTQLRATLRDSESPEPLTVELDKQSLTFTLLGTTSEVRQASRREQMAQALAGEPDGLTATALAALLQWRRDDVLQVLRSLQADSKVAVDRGSSGGRGGRPAELWRLEVSVPNPNSRVRTETQTFPAGMERGEEPW